MTINAYVAKNRTRAPEIKKQETLKGVLLNTYIKKDNEYDNFEKITTDLLIPIQKKEDAETKPKETSNSFDYKKTLLPTALIGGIGILSTILILGWTRYSPSILLLWFKIFLISLISIQKPLSNYIYIYFTTFFYVCEV